MIGGKKGRKVLLHVDRMNSIYPSQKHSERVVAREVGRSKLLMYRNIVKYLK